MGRGKKIDLETAETFLGELKTVEPVERGYYASVSAFISEHHEAFAAALARGISHEQIADMMQGHDITISPTTLRRYLPKKEISGAIEPDVSSHAVEFEFIPIERLVCVAIAAMSILEAAAWQTFYDLCKLFHLSVEYETDAEGEIRWIAFTYNNRTIRWGQEDPLIELRGEERLWHECEPEFLQQSTWVREGLEQDAPILAQRARRLAEEYRASAAWA